MGRIAQLAEKKRSLLEQLSKVDEEIASLHGQEDAPVKVAPAPARKVAKK